MDNCDLGTIRTSTGNVNTFVDDAEAIWETYLDDKRLREFSMDDRPPDVRTRFPVTQEFMVAAIVAERNGESPPHPAKQHFSKALHESIERMVGMLAAKYSITCVDEERDLAQDCILRVWTKLHRYNPEKAKFSTWAWRVCVNVLNKEYRLSKRMRENISIMPDEEIDRNPGKCEHYETVLGLEYVDAIRELGVKYPKWKSFLYSLLGNPDTGFVPGKICVAHAATATGVGRGTAMNFYHRKVQPFMKKRFKQEQEA